MKKFNEVLKESDERTTYIRDIRHQLTMASGSLTSGKTFKTLDRKTQKALREAEKHVDKARKILFDVQ